MSLADRTVNVRFAAMLDDDELAHELCRLWVEIRDDRTKADSYWHALKNEAAARWLRQRVKEPA